MAKKIINVNAPDDFINTGSAPNARDGDSLRSSFARLNQAVDNIDANFTELYTTLGLNADGTPNLGAFEFNGSVMTTTDSSNMTIGDEGTTVNIGGDLVPTANLNSNLGSPTKKWHSLYVGTGSVYLGDARLSLEDGKITSNVGFNLTGSVGEVSGAVDWVNVLNKPTIPTSFDRLVNGASEVVLDEIGFLTIPATVVLPEGVITYNGEVDPGIVLGSSINSVFVRTLNGINQHTWKFGTDGNLHFPDSSFQGTAFVGDASRLYGNVDEDVEVTVRHRPAVSAQHWRSGGVNNFVADTSDNDDITVVQEGWTVDIGGTVYTVTATIGGGDEFEIYATGATFVVGTTYTFTNPTATLKTWTFGTDSGLTLPAGFVTSNEVTGINLRSGYDVSIISNHMDVDREWIFGSDGSLTVPGAITQGDAKLDLNWSGAGYVMLTSKTDYTTSVFLGEGQASLTGRVGASISVGEAGQNARTTYEQKVIELDAAFAADSWTGAGYPAGPTSSQALNLAKALNPLIPDAWITIANELKTAWDTWQEVLTYSDVLIAVGGSDNVWKFDPTGNLTLPNNAVIRTDGNNVEVGGVTNFNVEAAGVVNIYTDDGAYQWQFGDDGALQLPAGGAIAEGGGLTGAIRLTPAGGANANQALLIYPTGAPEGDHIHLTAGGGDTELYLGNDFHYVKLVNGGDVQIQASTANVSATAAWNFSTDGTLTLPDGSNVSEIIPGTGAAASIVVIQVASSIPNEDFVSLPPAPISNYSVPGTDIIVNVTWVTNGPTFYSPRFEVVDGGTGHTGGGQFSGGEVLTVPYNDMGITIVGDWTWYVNDLASNFVLEAGLNEWTFGGNGALTFPDATVQTTASVQGEQVFTLDTGAIDYAPVAIDFNLLFVTAAVGYSGTDPISVTLPNGVPGQRLVIFNGYNLATLTVNPGFFGRDISSGVVAEFIYSGFDGLWMPLYGTNSPT